MPAIADMLDERNQRARANGESVVPNLDLALCRCCVDAVPEDPGVLGQRG
jgi:hypothetical protein